MKRAFLVALALLFARGAHADGSDARSSYRVVIDRVDLEPSAIGGDRLRVYLSALGIGGHLLDLTDPHAIRLYVGSSELHEPFALGRYGQTDADTAIVFCVQATMDYSDVLPRISDALSHDVIGALGDHAQVAVLTYGDAPGSGKLLPIKVARSHNLSLSSDGSAGDPVMLDAIDRALRLLRRAKSDPEGRPLRKMIVVIGDGRFKSGDRDRVTRLGKLAAKEGVRIHTIAYSPNDVRRPMLALGELSKQSLGTLRWVRQGGADSWSAALRQLRDEIQQQYVITYFVTPADDVAGKRLHVVTAGRTVARSNEVKIPETATCMGTPCDGYCADTCVVPKESGRHGVLGILAWAIGLGAGVLVLLGLVGYAMTRREQRRAGAGPLVPGAPVPPGSVPPGSVPPRSVPPAMAPGLLPSGRPIPALLVANGPRAGERILLRHGFWIGKQPGCDLLIEDGYTSSQHAQIGMDAGGTCILFDRGSTNGTFVDNVRITQIVLVHGVTIRIGSTELRFLAQ